MSAKLYFSNSPLILLDKLSENLDWADPFLSPHIATPTPAMKRWVQMRLAEKMGIIANVDFLQLERMLWHRLENLDSEHFVEFRKPAKLLDEQGLQLLILSLLNHASPQATRTYLEKSDFGPGTTREKGKRNGYANERVFAKRLCQLSQKLAGFFREYEYSRVREHGHLGLAHAWKHGENCFLTYLNKNSSLSLHNQVESLESWQRDIYHELFRIGGLRDSLGELQGQYQYTLPQYAEMVLEQTTKPREAFSETRQSPPSYHLFGLSQVSSFHRSLIQRLADKESLQGREAQFYIYSLNPCSEYWEDVLTPKEKQAHRFSNWRQLDDPAKQNLVLSNECLQAEELPEEIESKSLNIEIEDNPLLSQWGKPGRENIRLWCQITEYDFFEYFNHNSSPTVLSKIQGSILNRRGKLPPEERIGQDDSLQILACPEIHREVETVYHGILQSLLQDPSLRPDDIAVVVPKMSDYREVLAAVFGKMEIGKPGHIPFNLSDAAASAESHYARAIKQIFALSQGRFTRKEIFNLISNPCFQINPSDQSGIKIDEQTLKIWAQWTIKLNIFHGYNQEDKLSRGYASESSHTWSHGLDRLVLGTVMEAPAEQDLRHFEGIVPFADGNSSERELLQHFFNLVENLNRDLAPLRENEVRSWSEWLEIFEAIFDRYLTCPPSPLTENFVQSDIRRYLTHLRTLEDLDKLSLEQDRIELEKAEPKAHPVTAAIPMNLILSHLDLLKAGHEPYLSGGVNVSGLSALRSLPFKIIYVLGLGEGRFPEEEESSTLDLRQYRRVIGEVTQSARNKYLLLETLVCAGSKLRLSYISRDMQQGKTIQMSSSLNELVAYLNEYILGPESFKPVQVPLLARDSILFETHGKSAWDPPPNPFRHDKILQWLEKARPKYPKLSEALKKQAPHAILQEIFPSFVLPTRSEKIQARQRIPLEDILLYLKNPVQYALQKRLGIRDSSEDDPLDFEDEPFYCPFPKDLGLLRNLVFRRLRNWDTTTDKECLKAMQAEYENLTLRGLMPEAFFRTLDWANLSEQAEAILLSLQGFFQIVQEEKQMKICVTNLTVGDGGSDRGVNLRVLGKPAVKIPPILIHAAGREFEFHGTLPCLFRNTDQGGCAALVFVPAKFKCQHLLPAFIFYLAALQTNSELGNWLRSGPFTLYYLMKNDSTKKEPYSLGIWEAFSISPERAKDYLESLLDSMFGEVDFDMLPFDLIANNLTENNQLVSGVNYTETLRDVLEVSEEANSDNAPFTPTETMILLDPQVPENAELKIRARFSLFFNSTSKSKLLPVDPCDLPDSLSL